VVELDRHLGDRIGDWVLGCAALLTKYALGGFFLGLALHPAAIGAHPDLFGRLLAAAIAIGVYAFGRWGRRQLRTATDADAGVFVQPDAVVVRHSALDGPAVIPRERIRAVAVDPVASPSSRHSLPVLTESGDARLTWLWLRYSGGSVPLLGPPARAPNFAILFDGTGLLLRVRDVAAAERAFSGWGVVRPLTGDDLAASAGACPPARTAARSLHPAA
jgi:hypothetical protein